MNFALGWNPIVLIITQPPSSLNILLRYRILQSIIPTTPIIRIMARIQENQKRRVRRVRIPTLTPTPTPIPMPKVVLTPIPSPTIPTPQLLFQDARFYTHNQPTRRTFTHSNQVLSSPRLQPSLLQSLLLLLLQSLFLHLHHLHLIPCQLNHFSSSRQ